MSAPHTPGRQCDACEGFCLHPFDHRAVGVELTLRIGQRVRHRDYKGQRITGVLWGLSIEGRDLMADVVLDSPIVIPASDGIPQIDIRRQRVPAHELAPFDDRDELIAELLAALQAEEEWRARDAGGAIDPEWDYGHMVGSKRSAAIAKASGGRP